MASPCAWASLGGAPPDFFMPHRKFGGGYPPNGDWSPPKIIKTRLGKHPPRVSSNQNERMDMGNTWVTPPGPKKHDSPNRACSEGVLAAENTISVRVDQSRLSAGRVSPRQNAHFLKSVRSVEVELVVAAGGLRRPPRDHQFYVDRTHTLAQMCVFN